jgi:hypothetical protein
VPPQQQHKRRGNILFHGLNFLSRFMSGKAGALNRPAIELTDGIRLIIERDFQLSRYYKTRFSDLSAAIISAEEDWREWSERANGNM